MAASMSVAIGSTTSLHAVNDNKSSGAALQKELARYQSKLSEAGSSTASKTPEGKAKAAAISSRIKQIQQQLGKSGSTRSTSGTSNTSRVDMNVASNDSNTRKVSNLGDTSPAPRLTNSMIGSRIDTYA